jgi:L-ascorbate metabolism protein UlaG (beta-lactamase superfamily)
MQTLIVLILANILLTPAFAQRPTPDKIETSAGPLMIQPILHGSLVLTWNDKTIYVDPYGGAKAFEGIAAPDLILITDIHGDHLNAETLNAIKTDKAKIVAPQAVADQLPDNLKGKAVVLSNGNRITQSGIAVSALPM